MYLDFGHRSADLERDVDCAPILADFKRDSTYQLAFCGPACSYDGAYWADKDRCALTGVTQSGEQLDGPPRAFLDVYDFRFSMRGRWPGPTVDERGYRSWQAASDSALAERIARAWEAVGIDTSTSSRIDLRGQ
jgi:hypothetical protein